MRFPFRFAASYRVPAHVLGITPRTAYVDVGSTELDVRFGLWRLRTPVSNVAGDDAVCVRFREPVRVLDPTGRLRHPGATLTVADPDDLAAALTGWRSRPGP